MEKSNFPVAVSAMQDEEILEAIKQNKIGDSLEEGVTLLLSRNKNKYLSMLILVGNNQDHDASMRNKLLLFLARKKYIDPI
jgi:hypothetical protein